MKEYFTFLQPRKLNVRNNVKSAMIQEFLLNLHGAVNNKNGSISSVYTVPMFTMINFKRPFDPLQGIMDHDINSVPCLNPDCEWIQFMSLFHPSQKLWSLPAVSDNGYCMACKLAALGKLDRSKIKITKGRKVMLE